jgi:flavodoxin
MKILIVYYSRTGTTKKIATELAAALSADIEEINELKSRRGIWGWITAGRDSSLRKETQIADLKSKLEDYDLVIVCTPIWAWTISTPMRQFLLQYANKIKQIGFVVTMGGSGAQRAFTHMQELCKKTPRFTAAFIEKKVKNGEYKQELAKIMNND